MFSLSFHLLFWPYVQHVLLSKCSSIYFSRYCFFWPVSNMPSLRPCLVSVGIWQTCSAYLSARQNINWSISDMFNSLPSPIIFSLLLCMGQRPLASVTNVLRVRTNHLLNTTSHSLCHKRSAPHEPSNPSTRTETSTQYNIYSLLHAFCSSTQTV